MSLKETTIRVKRHMIRIFVTNSGNRDEVEMEIKNV